MATRYSCTAAYHRGGGSKLPRDNGLPTDSACATCLPCTVDSNQSVHRREHSQKIPHLRRQGLPGIRRAHRLRGETVHTRFPWRRLLCKCKHCSIFYVSGKYRIKQILRCTLASYAIIFDVLNLYYVYGYRDAILCNIY